MHKILKLTLLFSVKITFVSQLDLTELVTMLSTYCPSMLLGDILPINEYRVVLHDS